MLYLEDLHYTKNLKLGRDDDKCILNEDPPFVDTNMFFATL